MSVQNIIIKYVNELKFCTKIRVEESGRLVFDPHNPTVNYVVDKTIPYEFYCHRTANKKVKLISPRGSYVYGTKFKKYL